MRFVRCAWATAEPTGPAGRVAGHAGDAWLGVLDEAGGQVCHLRAAYSKYLEATGAPGDPEKIARLLFPTSMREFIELGALATAAARQAWEYARETGEGLVPLAGVRLLAPLSDPPKIVAVGLNYREHARESGMQPPQNPVFFAKFATAIAGPGDAIARPARTQRLDYEVELAVVIGRRGRRIPEAQALDYVFGYTVFNDISARDLQFEDGQWIKGKTCDGFAPLGPAIVTREEIPDPQQLGLWLEVNGERRQQGSTADMIFSVARLVSYLSELFTLQPGDIIATGTPPGVGMARRSPEFLRPGDRVRACVEGIGVLENVIVAEGA